jgi:hypothetical protein
VIKSSKKITFLGGGKKSKISNFYFWAQGQKKVPVIIPHVLYQ